MGKTDSYEGGQAVQNTQLPFVPVAHHGCIPPLSISSQGRFSPLFRVTLYADPLVVRVVPARLHGPPRLDGLQSTHNYRRLGMIHGSVVQWHSTRKPPSTGGGKGGGRHRVGHRVGGGRACAASQYGSKEKPRRHRAGSRVTLWRSSGCSTHQDVPNAGAIPPRSATGRDALSVQRLCYRVHRLACVPQ